MAYTADPAACEARYQEIVNRVIAAMPVIPRLTIGAISPEDALGGFTNPSAEWRHRLTPEFRQEKLVENLAIAAAVVAGLDSIGYQDPIGRSKMRLRIAGKALDRLYPTLPASRRVEICSHLNEIPELFGDDCAG